MRFFTPQECIDWCEFLGIPLDGERPFRKLSHPYRLRCSCPARLSQLFWFSGSIENALQPRRSCLVWATESGVWPSSENEHLYYRFRQSYSDHRLLHEAPGHLCLQYEKAEVSTLVYLGILFGWDIHLIPTAGYAQAFVCHDEWVEIGFDDEGQFNETRMAWEKAKLTATVPP